MSDDCKNCRIAIQFDILQKDYEKLSQKVEDNYKQQQLEINEIKTTQRVAEEQVHNICKILDEIRTGVERLTAKLDVVERVPQKRWELIIKNLITIVVTACVSFLLGIRQ